MNYEKRVLLFLGLLAESAGEKVSQSRIEFTARKLLPLGAGAVCLALERMLESAKRFPTVADVKAEMGLADPTPRDEALMLADVILAAIAKYGYSHNHKHTAAVEWAVGPAAWELVKRQGGWNAICDRSDGENLGVLRAQLRDLAESYLKTGVIARGEIPKTLPRRVDALAAVSKDPKVLEATERDRQAALSERKAQLVKEHRLALLQEEHQAKKGGRNGG